MAFTDHMLACIREHQHWCWDTPLAPPLRAETKKLGSLLDTWAGRQFQGRVSVRTIHSDSSDLGWGVDINSQTCVQEFWRDQSGLHINIKELQAAVHTLKSLAQPREVVTLGVDNLVAFWYLKKGGRKTPPLHFPHERFVGVGDETPNTLGGPALPFSRGPG
jgi:hypothetical protein